MDEVTLYIVKSWSLFFSVLLPVGIGLVLLIDWIFNKFDENKKDKHDS